MSLIALSSGIAVGVVILITGIVFGVIGTAAVVEHFVRSDEQFTYKWGRRWYTVRDRSRH